jgi:RimJ/RimL family protein N-acetyltransferase
MSHKTQLGEPIGAPVPDWTPPPAPTRMVLEGRYCRLKPLALSHAPALFDALSADAEGRIWTYMPNGPFASADAYRDWVWGAAQGADPLHYAILVEGRPVGTASYLRIAPSAGSIEVGYITYSPALQRTRAATEAMYLMMAWAFEAGYRRYEWKCNALNAASRRAAQRLGLSYEGVFRQAVVVKGRNRDSAWYAAIDSDWPTIRAAMERWLDPANFDGDGVQRQSLSPLTRPVLVASG